MFRVYKSHSPTLNHFRIMNFPKQTGFLLLILLQEKTEVTMKISLLLKYRQWQYLARDYIQKQDIFPYSTWRYCWISVLFTKTKTGFQPHRRTKSDQSVKNNQWAPFVCIQIITASFVCWFGTLFYYMLHRLIFFPAESIFVVLLCSIHSRVKLNIVHCHGLIFFRY